MRILIGHKFLYPNGGSESYLFNQLSLLQKHGYKIALFGIQNSPPKDFNCPVFSAPRMDQTKPQTGEYLTQLRMVYNVIRNTQAMKDMEHAINVFKPDIVHLHSIYHHLSPAILNVICKKNIPVVMTLHDFKLICPAIYMMNGQGQPCMACKGNFYWNSNYKKML